MSKSPSDKPHDDSPRVIPTIGTLLLLFGTAIFLLALIGRRSQLPFMPRTWFSHPILWYFLGGASFLSGTFLLKTSSEPLGEIAPQELSTAPTFHSAVIYTRDNCPLCDVAKQTLQNYADAFSIIQEIDIETDPQLLEQFSNCVPVIEIDGKVRFRGQINEQLLRRLIDGAAT